MALAGFVHDSSRCSIGMLGTCVRNELFADKVCEKDATRLVVVFVTCRFFFLASLGSYLLVTTPSQLRTVIDTALSK